MRLPWMSRTDRRRWRAATTLPQLGELMALWLEGDIASQPGYQPRYGPDEETRDLTPVLAAACRAGYVTIASQPGCREITYSGATWLQRAAVEGFVDDSRLLRHLVDAAERAGLEIVINDLMDPVGDGALPTTTRDGETITAFGGALGWKDLDLIWRECSRPALDAAATAAQVTLVDRTWGPSTLVWDALEEVIRQHPSDGTASAEATAAAAPAIDRDTELDKLPDEEAMRECALCGAPFHGSRLYCSESCEDTDADPVCENCGCTDDTPCQGGCHWAPTDDMTDLCSTCAPSGVVTGRS